MAWLFGRNAKWDLGSIAPPWGERPGIHAHVAAHVPDVGAGLREGGDALPDEDAVRGEDAVGWVAGGRDGAYGHHVGALEEPDAKRVFADLRRALEAPTQRNIHAFYARVADANALEVVDPLMESITKGALPSDRLEDLARWLAAEAADREPVKLGIALLGLFPGTQHHALFHTLGRHEELTLYAAVALSNSDPDAAERHLFELARHVTGWGRIQIVERLADTQDTEIQGWMLRQGYRNEVMYEYLAFTCATAGRLRDALEAEHVDDALLAGAGDLIGALITGDGGPAEGMADYDDGAAVVEAYLRHLEPRLSSLDQLLTIATIDRFVTDDDEDWAARAEAGWTGELRERVRARTSAMLRLPTWRDQVERGVGVDGEAEFWKVAQAAKALGMDIWEVHLRRTEAGENHWFELMQTEDPARITRVVALAEARLPLPAIASGPAMELGLGTPFQAHMALDFIVQELRASPGVGWRLVQTALRSPTIRNRNMAIQALSAWGPDAWPDGAHEALARALREEPHEDVKRRLRRLVEGEPLDD